MYARVIFLVYAYVIAFYVTGAHAQLQCTSCFVQSIDVSKLNVRLSYVVSHYVDCYLRYNCWRLPHDIT